MTPSRTRTLVGALLIAILAAVLSGCGNSQASDSPAQEQQKVTDAAAAARTDAMNREALRNQQNQQKK